MKRPDGLLPAAPSGEQAAASAAGARSLRSRTARDALPETVPPSAMACPVTRRKNCGTGQRSAKVLVHVDFYGIARASRPVRHTLS